MGELGALGTSQFVALEITHWELREAQHPWTAATSGHLCSPWLISSHPTEL